MAVRVPRLPTPPILVAPDSQGAKLRAWMDHAGYSCVRLAQRLGVDRRRVWDWCTNQRSPRPRVRYLLQQWSRGRVPAIDWATTDERAHAIVVIAKYEDRNLRRKAVRPFDGRAPIPSLVFYRGHITRLCNAYYILGRQPPEEVERSATELTEASIRESHTALPRDLLARVIVRTHKGARVTAK